MLPILESAAPVSLAGLATRIRRSSNFRFNWQWFSLEAAPTPSPTEARRILDNLVSAPESHRFLQDSFSNLYDASFTIEPIHEHCNVVETTHDFDALLARAATDRLGAYSRQLVAAPASEAMAIREIFGPVFPYSVFSLEPGEIASCPTCKRYNNHLFTNWFYGVAWDWCFCLLPHGAPTAWVGCLSDTD